MSNNDGRYDLYTPKYKKKKEQKNVNGEKDLGIIPLHRDKIYYPTGIDQRYVEDPDHNPTIQQWMASQVQK